MITQKDVNETHKFYMNFFLKSWDIVYTEKEWGNFEWSILKKCFIV